MSSFFSRPAKSASSSAASSIKGKEAPKPTAEIFTSPPDGVVPSRKWEYNDEQVEKIEQLKAYSATLVLPESDPYHRWEARFLADPGCHPRYMRAAKWRLPEAQQRLKGTMEWRREYKPELIEPDDVKIEAATGKIIISGFDVDARPVLYMRPGRENTETSPRQIRHLIYCLERAIDFMPPGQDQVAIVVDYKSATSQSNPSISTARKVLSILQNHYVERLGRGLVVNMPWWINAFFTAISPFMDPITRDKIRFNPKLTELIPPAQLDYEFGGDYNLEYEPEHYWKTMSEFCRMMPDGRRKDNEGNAWCPPLGNGIKAATDGLVPTKGATQIGHTTTADAPDADDGVTGSSGATAGEKRENGAAAAAAVVSGDSKSTPAQELAEKVKAETAAGQVQQQDDKDEDEDEDKTVNGLPTEMDKMKLKNGIVHEPPARLTEPGVPALDGQLVFDHPPSKTEIKQVQKEVGMA